MSRQAPDDAPRRTCPICAKPAVAAQFPFCSDRCSKLDLARWLGGHYVLPGETPLDGAAGSDTGEGEEW